MVITELTAKNLRQDNGLNLMMSIVKQESFKISV